MERFLELSLFYRLFSPLDSEMICIFVLTAERKDSESLPTSDKPLINTDVLDINETEQNLKEKPISNINTENKGLAKITRKTELQKKD